MRLKAPLLRILIRLINFSEVPIQLRVTRHALTVLFKDTLTGKPSGNRTRWSVGIFCQPGMCVQVIYVIRLSINTHTQHSK